VRKSWPRRPATPPLGRLGNTRFTRLLKKVQMQGGERKAE
jgi:hypothetical protein